jgi:hypothetical protein
MIRNIEDLYWYAIRTGNIGGDKQAHMDVAGDVLYCCLKDSWSKNGRTPSMWRKQNSPGEREHGTAGSEKTALPPGKAGNAKVTTVETSTGDDRKKGGNVRFSKFLAAREATSYRSVKGCRVSQSCRKGAGCQRKSNVPIQHEACCRN